MSNEAGPLLSVRGDARTTVAPDYATLFSTITISRESKAAALQAAATALERLTAALTSLGGTALTSDTERHPLTWSARSATTRVEQEFDKRTGLSAPTGQVSAAVMVVITARALDRLEALGAVLASHDTVAVQHVGWDVDWDNPAWPGVRSAAIHAAIGKGRDYAAALGGSLQRVEHLADVGLLGNGSDAQVPGRMGRYATALSAGHGEPADTPSLDPVPQELNATVEARFTTTGVSLPE